MSYREQIALELVARDKTALAVKSLENRMMGLSRTMLNVAGIGGGIYAVSNMLRQGVTEAANFERAIAKVSTQLHGNAMTYLPEYEKKIKQLSVAYGESKESLAAATFSILSGQIAPAKAMDFLTKSLQAAKGGFIDVGRQADLDIQIMNAYKNKAYDLSRIHDILSATVYKSRGTFEDYASQLGNVLGISAKLGVDLDALGAAYATMTRAGLSADMAITSLKNIMTQYLDPSAEATKAAAELGFNLNSASLKGDGLIKVIQGLKKANNEQLKALMPNIRGLVGFAGALENAGDAAEDYKFISASTGLAMENMNKAIDNHAAKLEKLGQRWSWAKEKLGEFAFEISDAPGKIKDVIESMAYVNYGQDAVFGIDKIAKRIKELEELKSKPAYSGIGSIFQDTRNRSISDIDKEINALKELGMQRDLIKSSITVVGTDGAAALDPLAKYRAQIAQAKVTVTNIRDALSGSPETDEGKRIQKFLQDQVQSARAVERMYADMGEYGDEYWNAVNIQLNDQVRQFKAAGASDVDAAKWRANELKRLEDEIAESRMNAIDSWAKSYSTSNIWNRLAEDSAQGLDSLASSMSEFMITGESDWRAWTNSLLRAYLDAINKMIIANTLVPVTNSAASWIGTAISSWLGGAASNAATGSGGGGDYGGTGVSRSQVGNISVPQGHTGGYAGMLTMRKIVDSSAFANAPKYHMGKGLDSNEVALIAEKDELLVPNNRVIRNNSSASSRGKAPGVIVNNNTGQKFEQDGEPKFDGENWVVSIIAKNIREGGSLKKMMNQK